ncbi:MAG: hypothetical protein JO246_08540 [Frankiaceae bacterium]|nr:hypothetical protein [Frankiaceae bacterium]
MAESGPDAGAGGHLGAHRRGHRRWVFGIGQDGAELLPGWLRPHRGEQRWAVLAVLAI